MTTGRRSDQYSTTKYNRCSHASALFTVGRISRIVCKFLESKPETVLALIADKTGIILNSQLHGYAFLVASDIDDIVDLYLLS